MTKFAVLYLYIPPGATRHIFLLIKNFLNLDDCCMKQMLQDIDIHTHTCIDPSTAYTILFVFFLPLNHHNCRLLLSQQEKASLPLVLIQCNWCSGVMLTLLPSLYGSRQASQLKVNSREGNKNLRKERGRETIYNRDIRKKKGRLGKEKEK